MSTVMLMEWNGLTQDQYTQVMRTLDLDKNPRSRFHWRNPSRTRHLGFAAVVRAFSKRTAHARRAEGRRYHSTASAVLSPPITFTRRISK